MCPYIEGVDKNTNNRDETMTTYKITTKRIEAGSYNVLLNGEEVGYLSKQWNGEQMAWTASLGNVVSVSANTKRETMEMLEVTDWELVLAEMKAARDAGYAWH